MKPPLQFSNEIKSFYSLINKDMLFKNRKQNFQNDHEKLNKISSKIWTSKFYKYHYLHEKVEKCLLYVHP